MTRTTRFRRALAALAAFSLGLGVLGAGTAAPAAAAEVGFSVDDFAGNSMGVRELLPQTPMNCDRTGNTQVTPGSGTLRVAVNVPDAIGCTFAAAAIRWTAESFVDIEQAGADRIQLKYRDVTPNQPSAVVFGLTVVDINGKTGQVGGLSRNGGAAGDWLTIRYASGYAGDVSFLTFEPGFDRSRVKSVTLTIAATTPHQNVGVTFEGIGGNVGEPVYAAPSFGGDSTLVFAPSTTTTRTITVTGNPAPDVSVVSGKPAWMTVSPSKSGNTTTITLSGNPGATYGDTTLRLHADVANTLTANRDLRIVVPSPVSIANSTSSTTVGSPGPVTLANVSAVPAPTVLGPTTGLPPGTALTVASGSVRLTGTPTEPGSYTIRSTIGSEFASAPFVRNLVVGQAPSSSGAGPLHLVRGEAMTPVTVPWSGYGTPTVTATGVPTGLTVSSAGVFTGTPTVNGEHTVRLTGANSFGSSSVDVSITVGDRPTVSAPSAASVRAGTAVNLSVPVTGAPTGGLATGLPAGLALTVSGGEARVTGTPTEPADAASATGSATIQVSNAFGSATATWNWSIDITPVISGPTRVSTSVGSPLAGAELTVSGRPAPTVTVNGASSLPAGLTLDTSTPGTYRIIGTPSAAGTATLTFSADNGIGPAVERQLTVRALLAPSFSDASPNLGLVAGTTEQLTLDWGGHERPTLSLQSTLPPWIAFSAATGTFTVNAPSSAAGAYGPFTVRAANDAGTADASVTITVLTAPEVTVVTPAVTATRSASFPSDLIARYTGHALPGVIVTGLPTGLSATASGGEVTLSGTPIAPAGDYVVTITATNNQGSDSATLTITVATPATLTAPTTHQIPVGDEATLPITVGGYPKPQLAASGLPAGLTLDAAAGTVSGTPTSAGVYTVVLSTTGGHGTAPAPITMTLTVASTPHFQDAPTTMTLLLGTAVDSTAFTVSGVPLPTFTADGLPAGLTLTQSGGTARLVGTPTVAGEFEVDIALTSSAGSLDASFTIVVSAPATVTAAPTATVRLDESITPIPVTTTGYPAPTVTAASLPAGLSLTSDSGGVRITGTPTGAGAHTVTLTASNGVGSPATATIAISVESTPDAGPDRTVAFPAGETSTLVISATGHPAPVLSTSTLPSWLVFDAATGTFTATPAAGDAGPAADVVVTAANAVASDTATIRLSVTTVPAATTPAGTTTVRSWDDVDAALTAVTGFPAPALTATGLPDGLRLDIVDGVVRLTGTTAELGTHAVTATLANGTVDTAFGWTIVVERAEVIVTLSSPHIRADEDIEVTATGLQPGESIEVWMHSTPVLLARAAADATGTARVTVRIPSSAALGAHTIVVRTPTGDTGSHRIEVAAALAATGPDITGVLAIALLALGAGAALMRRRQAA